MASESELRKKFASLIRNEGANVHSSDQNPNPPADYGQASDLFKRAAALEYAALQPKHLAKGKKEYDAIVAKVVTNKSVTDDNYVPGTNNAFKGREQDSFNIGTESANYHIAAFVPDIHSALYGFTLPGATGDLAELYENEGLVQCIPENDKVTKTYGVPNEGDEIVIYYDPMQENDLALYRRKKSTGVDIRPALDQFKGQFNALATRNMSGGQFFSPPILAEKYHFSLELGSATDVGTSKFIKKAPSEWLKACAQNNNWGAHLVESPYVPLQKSTIVEGDTSRVKQFFEPRVFTNTKAVAAEASANDKLFGIVLSDGATNLKSMWVEFEKQAGSTHYGIDHYGKVHEFVDSSMVAYHSFAGSCPGNNLLSIGISYCQFGFDFETAFNDNDINSGLRTSFRKLLQGGYLPIGNPDFIGIPSNILAKSSVGFAKDTYMLASKLGLENSWKLVSCLASKYGMPLDAPAIVKYLRSNSNNSEFKDPNKTPYVYDFFDLSNSTKNNFLCGYDGLIKYPGIRARNWMTAGRSAGGSAAEYYMYCRMSGLNSDESYYATIASLILPGATKGSKLDSSIFIDLESYAKTFGLSYLTKSFVPNPSRASSFLVETGKKVFNIVDPLRRDLLIKDTYSSTDGTTPITFTGLAGKEKQDAHQEFLYEKDNYLGIEPSTEHCMYIVDAARKKVFSEYKYINSNISDSKYEEYNTPFGQMLTRIAVNMFHTSAKYVDLVTPVTIMCAGKTDFEKNFSDKYKMNFKEIINI